jgi:hypothetical protein
MKRLNIIISLIIICSYLLSLPSTTQAQKGKIRLSLDASVTQRLGLDTDITIKYCRPGVKGRVIWGELVPYDKVWRAGANENTTIEFNNDLLIQGQKLPAGKYGFWIIPSKKDWTIIFSKVNNAWGLKYAGQEQDALRVTVTPVKAPHQEWLIYGFDDLAGTSATAYLYWEQLKAPIKIELAQK